MLLGLNISNYILIDSLDIQFPEGLVIITGETGAGKSILLGALSLALGAKADAGMIGPRGDKCTVEAEWDISGNGSAKRFLEENGLDDGSSTLLIRRVVSTSGRSRSFINDEPVALPLLQELSAFLVDIHSQHQSLKLSRPEFRLDALDSYCGNAPLRENCRKLWDGWQKARRELEQLRERILNSQNDHDYKQARWEKLQNAHLTAGEMEALEDEHRTLAHAEEIRETLGGISAAMGTDDVSLTGRLREAGKLLERAGRFLPGREELGKRMESARLELEDIEAELESAAEKVEVSPQRLQDVEERMGELFGLMKQFGKGSVEELISVRDALGAELSFSDDAARDLSLLEKKADAAMREYRDCAAALRKSRSEAATSFSAAVEELLHGLDLEDASFGTEILPAEEGPTGADSVRFLFTAGHGTLQGVEKASGGEVSRIMLSIKAMMARHAAMPSLVFDEIDTGVSGSAADKMGSLICRIGEDMQVFAITHLPQVAAKGQAHYLVEKKNGESSIRRLGGEERIMEIARMLSGSSISSAAIENAKSLLGTL